MVEADVRRRRPRRRDRRPAPRRPRLADQDDDAVQNTSGLRFFTAAADTHPSADVRTVEGSSTSLRAIHDLSQGVTLGDAVGGFVVRGTVQAAVGSRGGNDGKGAFDETFLNAGFPGGN